MPCEICSHPRSEHLKEWDYCIRKECNCPRYVEDKTLKSGNSGATAAVKEEEREHDGHSKVKSREKG